MTNYNANTNGISSSKSSLLSATIPVFTTQASAQPDIILPLSSLLPSGEYNSQILSTNDVFKNGIVIGIDCIHKLTDIQGNVFVVKFRLFTPYDTEALIQKLSSYGLTGTVGDALVGLEETVEIKLKPQSSQYMHIASREKLQALNSTDSDSEHKKETNHKKTGGLVARYRALSANKQNTQRQRLIEEDDEFDDFEVDEEY